MLEERLRHNGKSTFRILLVKMNMLYQGTSKRDRPAEIAICHWNAVMPQHSLNIIVFLKCFWEMVKT